CRDVARCEPRWSCEESVQSLPLRLMSTEGRRARAAAKPADSLTRGRTLVRAYRYLVRLAANASNEKRPAPYVARYSPMAMRQADGNPARKPPKRSTIATATTKLIIHKIPAHLVRNPAMNARPMKN